MKKKVLITVIAFFASALTIFGVVLGSPVQGDSSSISSLGTRCKQLHDSSDKSIAAYVNGQAIYKNIVNENLLSSTYIRDINQSYTLEKSLNANLNTLDTSPTPSYSDALNNIIKSTVLNQEAQKNGISVSDDEALSALKSTDDNIQKAMNSTNAQERKYAILAWNNYQSFIKGYGTTQEEYEKTIGLELEKQNISTYKLYTQCVNKMTVEQKNDSQLRNQIWNNYVDGLVDSSKVQIEE